MRIRVKLDVRLPLKRRIRTGKKDGDSGWINFMYKHLLTFCFFSDVIGHADKFCEKMFNAHPNQRVKAYGYGCEL